MVIDPSFRRPDRDTELQYLLIGAVGINLIPHLLTAPVWVLLVSFAFLIWKALHLRRGWPLPSRFTANSLAAFAALGVFLEYRTFFGPEAAASLLMLLACLKVIDSRSYRDMMLGIVISYFLLMSHLLESQSLSSTVFMAADIFILTTFLFHMHRNDRRGTLRAFRPVIKLMLFSAPIWVFIFVAFPRFTAGLGFLKNHSSARLGFNEDLEPGSVAEIARDETLVFRATFIESPGLQIPHPDNMYWRSGVLSLSEGLSWKHSPIDLQETPSTDSPGRWGYDIILEPGYQKLLFSLEMAKTMRMEDAKFERALRFVSNSAFKLKIEPEGRLLYHGTSELHSSYKSIESQAALKEYLQLPKDISPRVRKLADEIGLQQIDDFERARTLLNWFATSGFGYTLNPGKQMTGLDDFLFNQKKGFCEHYAAAFATLMRLMGTPSRVVVGFLGGKKNEIGSYYVVRNLDAHAWTEIYSQKAGIWIRIDPTLSVAPMRATLGGDFNNPENLQRNELNKNSILNRTIAKMQMAWDAAATQWTLFLLEYDFNYQLSLLARLGFDQVSRGVFILWLIIGAVILVIGIYGIFRLQAQREDPLLREWHRLCSQFKLRKLDRKNQEGALSFVDRVHDSGILPVALIEDLKITAELFNELRYGKRDDDHYQQSFKQFRKKVRELITSLKSKSSFSS